MLCLVDGDGSLLWKKPLKIVDNNTKRTSQDKKNMKKERLKRNRSRSLSAVDLEDTNGNEASEIALLYVVIYEGEPGNNQSKKVCECPEKLHLTADLIKMNHYL